MAVGILNGCNLDRNRNRRW